MSNLREPPSLTNTQVGHLRSDDEQAWRPRVLPCHLNLVAADVRRLILFRVEDVWSLLTSAATVQDLNARTMVA
jgi:hypothetical protein